MCSLSIWTEQSSEGCDQRRHAGVPDGGTGGGGRHAGAAGAGGGAGAASSGAAGRRPPPVQPRSRRQVQPHFRASAAWIRPMCFCFRFCQHRLLCVLWSPTVLPGAAVSPEAQTAWTWPPPFRARNGLPCYAVLFIGPGSCAVRLAGLQNQASSCNGAAQTVTHQHV